MSSKTSERSNLIDVTYAQLHSILSGHVEGTNPDQISAYLSLRISQLKSITDPFGRPSDLSRKKINSGSVTLTDGVVVRVEDPDKDFVFAISDTFQIDEISSLILFRSFLYNEGLPTAQTDNNSLVQELLEAMTPFYFSERLYLLRILIPLFRARENPSELFHDAALSILPQVLPDGQQFTDTLLSEYERKSKEKLPQNMGRDPRTASRWAKQNSKEQLVILEVLFWTLWGSVPCSGPVVEKVLGTAYRLKLGVEQQNATLLLDDEGVQLQRDKATLWIILTVEVLELETIADSASLDLHRHDFYTSSPESLKRIHELITTGGTGQFACTYLAWTFVLSRLCAKALESKEVPESYRPFFEMVLPQSRRAYSKDPEAAHVAMARTCLEPKAGLLNLMETLLTSSPLFVTSVAWKTGSTITDPNAIAFRSVFKGLVMSLVELVPVEAIPEFDLFVEVWAALFGRSESQSIAGICSQFWQVDWQAGLARRAIFDVSRTRFPIQSGLLIRLLRSMTASGFLDTDPLSTADHASSTDGLTEERELCARHVFYFLDKLPSYSQVIPTSACTGTHALYERQIESSSTAGVIYSNSRSISLPGGSILPAGSKGRLLNGDGGDLLVVAWQHEHSGWKLLLEVLSEYAYKLRSGSSRGLKPSSFGQVGNNLGITLALQDIGFEMDGETDESLVTNILDLVRSVIQDNPVQGEQLMHSLEAGSSTSTASPPDLVQLTTAILEEALTRYNAHPRLSPPTRLITSAISVLSAILAIPNFSIRVWIYIRSTTALFGSDKSPGFTSATLAAERVTGRYTMTLALLKLVEQLCEEASLLLVPEDVQVRKLKDEVLLRAARFVHTEVWLEHLGWKYAQLGDRFEIARRISSFYLKVMQYTPPSVGDAPFVKLSQAVLDLFLYKASVLAINPLISAISAGTQMLQALYSSRRFGDARRLIFLLESHLRFIRLILQRKSVSEVAQQPCLLEQALCAQVTGGAASHDPYRSKINPIEALAFYVKERDAGQNVPLEAIRVLSVLCSSLAMSRPNSTTLVAHLSDPEGVVGSFVRVVQHPYDDLSLRYSIWTFITIAMDKEPALASLFVAGQFRGVTALTEMTDLKGKGKESEAVVASPSKITNAVDVARDALANWEQLWESNPQLLSCVLRFLMVVWRHGLEHKAVLDSFRQDVHVWQQLTSLACSELGPIPDFETESYVYVEGKMRSNLHDAVAEHCYRTDAKACALQVIGLDIGIHHQTSKLADAKPPSYQSIESRLRSLEELTDLISEATPSSYAPSLYDAFTDSLQHAFPTLSTAQLETQAPLEEREFGDDFSFSTSLLRSRLRGHRTNDTLLPSIDAAERQLSSINLNLSLTRTQTLLASAWRFMLHQVIPYLPVDRVQRPILLNLGASVSFDIMKENRPGDMVATIHGTRIALLVSLLELAWFGSSDQASEVKPFIELAENVRGIVLNEYQPPSKSIQGSFSAPFHRPLLQLLYFCLKNGRSLIGRPKALNAEQRLKIFSMVEATLGFVIDALRLTFMAARTKVDLDLDKDMELLVAVFEQCTRLDINPSSTVWLARCQQTDIIKISLDLFSHIDLVGISDLPFLLSTKRQMYALHILTFHMALASIPSAAERFASEGVLLAYCNNSITKAANAGLIDEILPELPGQRSPAHIVYCSMLSILSAIIVAMGRSNHYFDAEACGLVQLYGDQIARALSWTIGDPITLALLEEIDQVIHVFSALAQNSPILETKSVVENVLRVFSPLALRLLQQLNYAITHPNHLASLFEPLTDEERVLAEKDSSVTDIWKRPLIAHLMHRLFQLSSNIIFTLTCISKADTVLIGEPSDWPVHEALVTPHSKVVVGEPASIGTLLELANGTLDMLRNLTNMPPGQSLVLANAPTTLVEGLNVRQGIVTARRNLEETMMYMVTQLAMWLLKPEFEVPLAETDGEDQAMAESQKPEVKERRGRRVSLNARLRRGLSGEMAADVQELLTKAKPIIAKTDTMMGKGQVDICTVLSTFLQNHIISPPA